MGIFGWSYPAGCDGTPYDEFPPCECCGKQPDHDCICPECPVCETTGDPKCYAEHGLTYSKEQLAGQRKLRIDMEADAHLEPDMSDEFYGEYQ